MSLLKTVVERLESHEIPFALIGAAAMAARGVARSTQDMDLLSVHPDCLRKHTWAGMGEHVTADVHLGDDADPLRGIVRLTRLEHPPVDIIVGRHGWQGDVIERAIAGHYGGIVIPIATTEDLILLKLYAGGTQDCADIRQLVETLSPQAIDAVDKRIDDLPPMSEELWSELRIHGLDSA